MVNKRVTLYLGCPGKAPDVYVSQFDTAWRFIFGIEYEGTEWEIPGGSVAMMNGIKPDGNVFSFAGTVSGNSVIVDCDIQMTVVAGKTICELSIIADNRVIATANFRLCVEEAPKSPSDISSESTIPAYGEILDELSDLSVNAETVPDISGLLNSTMDFVTVETDNSAFGGGGTIKFAPQNDNRVVLGYVNANGKRLYPLPAETPPPTANPPVRALMAVIKSWVGLENFNWGRENTLFDTECSLVDGAYQMVCSDFVSAVLLGISYENSRYVLGSEATNISTTPFNVNGFPQSTAPHRSQGGLATYELAQYFAEHGRLFKMPRRAADIKDTLRFGDIIFRTDESDSDNARHYYAIAHVAIVLHVVGDNHVIVAESSTATGNESSSLHVRAIDIPDNSSGYLIFARPDYRPAIGDDGPIAQVDDGFTYRPVWMPDSAVLLNDGTLTPAGQVSYANYSACTPDFLPAVPGSIITYTGEVYGQDDTPYIVRVNQYDAHMSSVKKGDVLASQGVRRTVTLDSATRYVRFTMTYASTAGKRMWLNETDGFDVFCMVQKPAIETVADIDGLLASEADKVLVENNSGSWGNGISCLYEKHNEWTANGYVRSNGDRMYPVPSMSSPVKHFSSYNWFQVALTWFNRSNLIHDENNSNGLFAENCVPVDGKYDFDCSEFVSAVLLGITYDNSRYALGSSADNVQTNYIAYTGFPASASPDRVKGGLLANELARLFAEQGLLYRVPEESVAETLQPGDILFWKDATETNNTYLHISHVGIVVDTIKNYVVVMDSGSDQTSYGYDTPVATRKVSVTNVHSQCPVFARPSYHTPVMPQSVRDYLKKGKLTCLSLIGASVRTSASADGFLQGEVNNQSHLRTAATKAYIPVEPGEQITYTGATSLGRGAFYCNVAKYDEAFNFLGRDNICTGGVAGSIVIQPGTAYIRFYYGFSSGDYVLTIPDIENNVSVRIGRDEIPTGGSAGQILAKTSGSNFDVGWVDMPTTEMQMETIASTTPTITLADNTWYQCEELTSLTVFLPAVSVRYAKHVIVFTSGATPTTTSFPVTILGLENFAAEANTVYEINIVDNRAVVGSWAVSASS